MNRKILSAVTALLAAVLLFGCGAGSVNAAVSKAAPATGNVNVMVLNGSTGFGAAGMISKAAAGETLGSYTFSVESDASLISAALINGSADIAALPTNAAAVLYAKTNGGVQVLALNTLGVLYVVADESMEINEFNDLRGKTVYAPAQNPTFILQSLCVKNYIIPGENMFIDNTYAQPAELSTALAAGEVKLALLPEPMVTIALSANSSLKVVLNITEEWNKGTDESTLVQGCIAVRTEFARNNPEEVKAFLKDYEESVNLMMTDPEAAAACVAEAGILAKASVAAAAMPNCNACFITESDMKAHLEPFYNALCEVAPESIGGAVPGDDFYCVIS